MKKLLITIPFLLLAAACNKQTAQVQPASPVASQGGPAQNPQAQTSQTAQPGSETVSGWKTYANVKYGYQFEYPNKGLAEDVNEKSISNQNSEAIKEDVVEFGYGAGKTTYQVTAMIGAIPTSSSLQTWLKDAVGIDNNINDYNQITVAGQSAYISNSESVVFLSNGSNVYKIAAVQDDNKSTLTPNSNDPTFSHIISSFQFTDETANWKTYINTKYGYELKYPENMAVETGSLNSMSPVLATGKDDDIYIGLSKQGDLISISSKNVIGKCSDLNNEQAIITCLGSASWAKQDRWVPITIDGLPAVRRETTTNPFPAAGSDVAPVGYLYYVNNGNAGVEISFGASVFNRPLMGQVLSTFKFVK